MGGACGLELDKGCFSNTQWQLSKQKRRCKECVLPDGPDGGTKSRAEHGAGDDHNDPKLHPTKAADDDGCIDVVAGVGEAGADDDRKDPQPPVRVAGDVGCAGKSAFDDDAESDEICGICLDVYDNPVQLSCGHSFCEVCLDGWHKKSKYDVHQPRNCPMCRRRAKPSKEIISKSLAW